MSLPSRKRKPVSFPTDGQVKRVIDVLASKGITVHTAQVLRDRVLLDTGEGREAIVANPWDKLV